MTWYYYLYSPFNGSKTITEVKMMRKMTLVDITSNNKTNKTSARYEIPFSYFYVIVIKHHDQKHAIDR